MAMDQADRRACAAAEAAALGDLVERNLIGRLWQRDASIFGLGAEATRQISAHLGWLFRLVPEHGAIEELVTVAKVAERHNVKRVLVVGDATACAWVEVVGRHLRQRRGAAVSTLSSLHPEAVAGAADLLRGKDALLVLLASPTAGPDDVVSATWPPLRAALGDDSRVALVTLGRADDADADHAERTARALGLRPSELRLCRALPAGVDSRFLTGSSAGLLVAALVGANVRGAVERIDELAADLRDADVGGHPAAPLAAWLAGVLGSGHRHLQIAVGRDIRAFGSWIAALLQGADLRDSAGARITVVAAPLPTRGPAVALPRTAVVAISTFEAPDDAAVDAAEDAGVPTWRLVLPEPIDLWAEALRWQAAVALLGALVGRDTVTGVSATTAATGEPQAPEATAKVARLVEIDAWLRPRVAHVSAADHVAIRCALAPTEAQRDRALGLQAHLQEQTAATVSVSFGPGPASDDDAATLRVWVADAAGAAELQRWQTQRAAPQLRVELDPLAAGTAVAAPA